MSLITTQPNLTELLQLPSYYSAPTFEEPWPPSSLQMQEDELDQLNYDSAEFDGIAAIAVLLFCTHVPGALASFILAGARG